jgi:hypothetical protein
VEITVGSGLKRAATAVALVCALGLVAAAPAFAAENPSPRFYSADDTSDAYGEPGVTWTGPPDHGAGRSGDPGDRAFALGGDGYLTVDDPTAGNVGSIPFTLRFWARFSGSGGPSEQVLSKRDSCSQSAFLDVRTRNGLVYAELKDHTNFLSGVKHPTDVYDDAWHEIIVSRIGTTVSVSIDGDTVSGQTNGIVDLDSDTPMRFGEGPCVTRPGRVGDGTTRADVLLDDISYGPGTTPTERPLMLGLPIGTPILGGPGAILGPGAPADPGAAGPGSDPAGPAGPADGPSATGPAVVPAADPAAPAAVVPADSPPGSTGAIAAAVLPGVGDAAEPSAFAGLDWTGVLTVPDLGGLPPVAPPAVGVRAVIPSDEASGERDRGVAAVAFAGALRSPDGVPWDLGSILQSLLLTLVLLALLALPVSVIDNTADANADRIRAVLARLRVPVIAEWSDRIPLAAAMTVSMVASAVLYGFVQPEFRFDESSLALVLGLAAAFLVVTVAQELSQLLYVGQWWGIRGHLALLPGFMLLGLVCVTVSRVAGLEPGLILGTLVAFGAARALRSDEEGPALAVSAAALTVVGLLAWFLRDPLVAATGSEGAFLPELVGAALSAITVASAGNLAFALIPIASLDGAALFGWSKAVWAFFAGLGGFAFVHILLQPSADAGAFVGRGVFVAVLLGAYLLGAAAFWAWFRFRRTPARTGS